MSLKRRSRCDKLLNYTQMINRKYDVDDKSFISNAKTNL